MNDYISKPVDEKLLFIKMIDLLKITLHPKPEKIVENFEAINDSTQYTNLAYLKQRIKSDNLLMKEMIRIYLDQTPGLINAMKESLAKNDWLQLKAAAHKLLPSFVIMGFDTKYQHVTKKIQEFDGDPAQLDIVHNMIEEIDTVCKKAYVELNEVLIKSATD